MKPKVSVVATSYNQEKYIRDALDGFLKQKTSFKFEIVITDDGSRDKTPQVIDEYAKKHPDMFKAVLRKKNVGSMINFIETLQRTTGEYIALCEGDDYWTDPNKLQLQTDFLDKHPDYSVCFHKVRIVYDNQEKKDQIYPDVEDKSWYTAEELLRTNYIQTNSAMYRKQDYKDLATDVMPGDWYMHLYHARFGKIKLIDKVMSVYRKHPGGIWWEYDLDKGKIWKQHGLAHLTMWVELMKLYKGDPTATDIIRGHINDMLDALMDVDERYRTTLLKEAIARFPDSQQPFMLYQHHQAKKTHKKIESLTTQLLSVGDERSELDRERDRLAGELQQITSTRWWRARAKVFNAVRKSKR